MTRSNMYELMRNSSFLAALILVATMPAPLTATERHVPSQHPTIQEAIDASVNDDIVIVADGVYEGAGNCALVIDSKRLTIRSASDNPAACIIDGGGTARGFLFSSSPSAGSLVQGFTIQNCSASDRGGGIYCRWLGSPTIANCVFSGNAAVWGGAVACYMASPTLTGCLLTGNTAQERGGGLYAMSDPAAPILTNCTISANSAQIGGGIACDHATVTLDWCTITGNSVSSKGGGVDCVNVSPLNMTDCLIANNTATSDGGGINCLGGSCPATLTRCTLSGNSSGWWGGALCCSTGGRFSMTACDLWANSARYGGALMCYGPSALPATLVNCRLAGNTAISDGGAFYCHSMSPSITNCTLVGNSAVSGGGLWLSDHAHGTVTNSILWANSAANGPQAYVSATGPTSASDLTVAYCDAEGGQAGIATGSYGTLIWGGGNLNADPRFIDLDGPDDDPNTWADNDNRLAIDSPCIDAGSNPTVPAGIITDLDATPRFIDLPAAPDTGVPGGAGGARIVDLGAYEYQCPQPGACCH